MKKSVVLVLACMVSVVLLILTAGFTAGVINEKLFMEKEKGVLQAINLAEAGLNCGIGELRNQINSQIATALNSPTNNIDAGDYIESTSKDSLDFLCDVLGYADVINSDFDEVAKVFSSSSAAVLNTGISGNYSGKVIVRKQRDENGQPMEGDISSDKYIFPYEFIVEATGISRGTAKTLRYLGGEFNINVVQDTFARYALFTNQNKTGPGGSDVLFTPTTKFTGPVHTNGNCNFFGNPAGVFTENVTQQDQRANFDGVWRDANFYGNVVPQFGKSFLRGVAKINLPSSVNTNDLATQSLGTMNNPGHDGIYVPSTGVGEDDSLTGGIYIQGDAKVNMSVSGSNAVYTVAQNTTETVTREVPNTGGTNCRLVDGTRRCQRDNDCCPYTWIKQDGSQGSWTTNSCAWHSAHLECVLATGTTAVTESVPVARVKTISVDSANNQTTVGTITTINGVSTQTNEVYSGIPNGVGKEGVIIYADGQITDLKGTVQKDSQVTVSAKNDIVIGNHIRYEQYSGSGITLSAEGYTNTLGIISCNGNVRIGTSTPSSGDLDVHATVMSPNGVFTVDNYNSRSIGGAGKVNLLGGAITNYYGGFGTTSGTGYGRNFVYDQRMLGATRPPYFPTLDTFRATSTELDADISDMALIWQEQ